MNTPATATLAEFARIAGFRSPSYVSRLRRAGRLVMAADGRSVRVAESLARIEATRDPSKVSGAARHAAELDTAGAATSPGQAMERGQPAEVASLPLEDPGIGSTFNEARTRREHWLALQAQRDYERSMDRLLDAGHVVAVVTSAAVTLRTRLEGLPDVMSAQLVGLVDEARIRALLADEIEHALGECSRMLSSVAEPTHAS